MNPNEFEYHMEQMDKKHDAEVGKLERERAAAIARAEAAEAERDQLQRQIDAVGREAADVMPRIVEITAELNRLREAAHEVWGYFYEQARETQPEKLITLIANLRRALDAAP